jgi:PAS domain S-box-containing protein
VEYVTTPLPEGGKVVGAVTVFTDVSERRVAGAELRENAERLRAALDASATGTFRWDPATGALDWDENLDRLFGLPPGRTARDVQEFMGLVHPEDRASVLAALARCVEEGADFDLEFRVALPDGSVRWVLDRGSMLRDARGRPLSMTGACTDITARKRSEEDLRRQGLLLAWQHRVLERIAQGAPLPETLDVLCREAEAQAPAHHYMVLLLDEEGRRLRHGAAPSLPPSYNAALDGIPVGEGVGSCGTAAHRRAPVVVTDIAEDPLWKDLRGLALPIGLRACWSTPILGSDGRLLGTWAVYCRGPGDPTPEDEERVRVATRLAAIAIERARTQDAQGRLAAIVQSSEDAIYAKSPEGRIVEWNPGAARLFGYSREEILGKPIQTVVPPEGIEEEAAILARIARGERVPALETVRLRKDGSRLPVSLSVSPFHDAQGRIVGASAIVRDVTERKRLEADLRDRAEQLARLAESLERSNRELDQFAYVTSHDLKAPLRGIANLSRWIEEDLGERVNAEARGHLDLLRGRVSRMEALIDAILEYSRVGRKKGKVEPVPVRRLLDDVVDLLAPPPGFAVTLPPEMPVVRTERARLQQVFMNLIGNAIKHHPEKERGAVAVGVEDAGAFWRFSVSDNGRGIPRRFHEKVFAVFQTLEARDKVEGTGIGLAIVKKVVESKGGRVELESDEGQGATFRFTWPKAEAGAG